MSSSDANKTALIHIPEEVNAIVNNQNISVKLGK